MGDDNYICQMDAASLLVAQEELFEAPKERLSQVETFRQWVTQQGHLKAPTDALFLLKFLRTAKFSQLRAREILQGHLGSKVKHPEWLNDLDTADPKMHDFLRTGFFVPMPVRDDKGRQIMIVDEGALKGEDFKTFTSTDAIRTVFTLMTYLNSDENVLVNGTVMFEDLSHFTMKHLTFLGMENMKKVSKLWEGKMPGRHKAFHFFNPGPVFEAIYTVCRPIFSKKLQDRFHIHGKNMEDIYKVIPKKCLPTEYLPDDYKGENPGSIPDIIEALIEKLKSPKVRDRILHETSSKWTIDESQKTDVPSESFRKLHVD